jgi:phosphoribosylaminoimidazolecarboxamide formyltransferase/IMP cyclohydrolase
VLVSVSDKTGLVPFVRRLTELGYEVLSTGGTRRHLEEAGVPVLDVSAYTGFPEVMDGRVKTLHPKVHGAILGRPDLPGDAAAIREHGITPFALVVCNLYPFEETIARPGVTTAEAIEQIDIGGPSMVRSAAKNHAYVGIVTRPEQYDEVLAALESGSLSMELRRRLAAAAFELTARYDRTIAAYMATLTGTAPDTAQALSGEVPPVPGPPPIPADIGHAASAEDGTDAAFPETLALGFTKRLPLRYGENPHQRAAFYVEPEAAPTALAAAEQLHGKELSYNNLLDLDAALSIAREFDEPAAVVIKHNNPCGCAVADTLAEALRKGWEGDPVSAFGSILGFNRPVNRAAAEFLCEGERFVEAIIAPGFDTDAFDALTTRPKWKKNVRLLQVAFGASGGAGDVSRDYRRVSGGLLVQDRDEGADPEADWQVVTERGPSAEELRDLRFVWRVTRSVKSNAIVLARGGMVVGVGAGQMSRLDSSFIAAHKAGERAKGSVLGSDAFFPFRDGVDQAAEAGVTAIIQPGGSRNDPETIAACNEHGLAMLFTGRRHFRH